MKIIATSAAPAAIGPYSQAIAVKGMLYCSGQIPTDPLTGDIVGPGNVASQTEQVFKNLTAVLQAGGASLDRVVKCTVFLQSMDDFGGMNEVYAQVFGEHRPARAAVEVARLPKNVLVEIDAIACLD